MTITPNAVLLFSTADWDEPYWTNKQHTAQALSARGIRVLYVESPGLRRPRISGADLGRVSRRLKRTLSPLTQKSKDLWICSVVSFPMGHRFRFVRWLNGAIIRRLLKMWLKQHGNGLPPIIWTFHPYILESLQGISTDILVYHCVDDLAVIPGIDADAFSIAERSLLATADVTFTTSPSLKAHCSEKAHGPVYYERNVADLEHFAQARALPCDPPQLAAIPRPRLGYVGVLSPYKLDLQFIIACVVERPDQQWIFIGEEPAGYADPTIAALRKMKNVHFLGYQSYKQLPSFLAGLDIATLPVRTDGYMKGVFPMKFYEYVAAGLPILTRQLGSLNDVKHLVYEANTPEVWAQKVDEIIACRPEPLPLDDPQIRAHSWEARLDRMLEIIATLQQSDH